MSRKFGHLTDAELVTAADTVHDDEWGSLGPMLALRLQEHLEEKEGDFFVGAKMLYDLWYADNDNPRTLETILLLLKLQIEKIAQMVGAETNRVTMLDRSYDAAVMESLHLLVILALGVQIQLPQAWRVLLDAHRTGAEPDYSPSNLNLF